MKSVIESLAHAVVSAVVKDLLPIKQPVYRFEPRLHNERNLRVPTGETKDVRPHEDQCDVYHFPQTWGSTALGFGGIGGAAITTAYTTVVVGPLGDTCVYFAGRLAYHVVNPSAILREDIARRVLAPARNAPERYAADLGESALL